jgi:RNA polymerase sigma-70 factor, ECF subfamily
VAVMAVESDLELMLRVRSGDADSFEVLLNRHRAPLVHYFSRMVRDAAFAEDLAQEVFLRVYKARGRYRPDARFTTWLYRIATNLALNAIRDRKGACELNVENALGIEPAAARIPDRKPTVEQVLMASDRERLIREAIDELPDNQRVAVILHKYQDVEYRQIARILKLSEGAVKSLLFRAYENLRRRLEPVMRGGQL